MSFFNRFWNAIRASVPTSDAAHPQQWLLTALGGGKTASGIQLTPTTALQHVSVAAAVRVLAEDVAKLPLTARRRPVGNRYSEPEWRRLYKHPVLDVFEGEPNAWQTSFGLKAFLTMSLVTHGNAIALKQLRSDGSLAGLIPIEPSRVQIRQNYGDPTLIFRVNFEDAQAAAAGIERYAEFEQDEIFWVQDALSHGGLWGLSRVMLGADTLGTAIAQDQYAARLFGQGARPPGALTTKEVLKPEARQMLARDFQDNYGGYENAGKIPVLHSGLEFIRFGSTAQEAQAVEAKKQTIIEVASMFRIPPHKLGHIENTPFSTLEELNKSYFDETISPIITNIEQAIQLQLLGEAERRTLKFDFDTTMFTRGRDNERWDRVTKAYLAGLVSANEARALADPSLPKLENDVRLVPVNTAVTEPDAPVEEMQPSTPEPAQVPGRFTNGEDRRVN